MKFSANIGGRDYAVVRESVDPMGFIYYVFDSMKYEEYYQVINNSPYPRKLIEMAQAVVFVEYNFSDIVSIKFVKNRFQHSETKELLQEILWLT